MENLGRDYVRTAFAKGLSERRVIFVHALRNSLIPLVTELGNAISLILAGFCSSSSASSTSTAWAISVHRDSAA